MTQPIFSNTGHCPICETKTTFAAYSKWLRSSYICKLCRSTPRERAIVHVLEQFVPRWRHLKVHESSPGNRASSNKLSKECAQYTATHYFPGMPAGSIHADGWRCEDLEAQTFDDGIFDVVVTQDVLEHVFKPEAALREIARTLKPGGFHIATTPMPFGAHRASVRRAELDNGRVEHIHPAKYHQNPIDKEGSLVTFDWGYDLADLADTCAPFNTTILVIENESLGIKGQLNEVILSKRKSF